jgi:type IV pilus assembly protein PilB
MSKPSSGLRDEDSTSSSPPRDEDSIFGDDEPQVSVEVERDEHSPNLPGEADGRPFNASADPPRSADLPRSDDGNPYAQMYESPDAGDEDSGAAESPKGVTHPSRPGSSSRFLTDVIVEMGLASRDRVDHAIESSRNEGITPERVLLAGGAITPDGLARALAERYGLDHLDLDLFPVDMGAANLVVNTAAKRYHAVPVAFVDKRTLLLAMADPSNVLAVDDVAIMTGYEVRVAVASPDAIDDLISRMARLEDVVSGESAAEETEESRAEIVNLRETADDAPVVKLVNQIVAQAVERGASDVHLAPDGHEVRVRVRVDGILQDITTVPRRMAAGVVSRVKIMAELDIAERRLPQDGRVSLTVDGRHVDLRVVTLPSVHGESIVMRILDKDSVVMKLEKLGMADVERERFERAFHETHGAVLVTGPTGSGKSTTLYAALLALNTPEKNIITVEDPVEYQLEGITQVQVSTKVGLTFATGLRAMVRADPDVIMVGEIRDRETAQIAVESALTGHLVLSTLHTNDAPSAITRLTEMGIEPFLVASALDCVLAQRLARMLCSNCKQRTIIPAEVLRENGYKALVDLEAYESTGCRRCSGTGYRGRLGIYEVMTLSSDIRRMALERRPSEEIRDLAIREGMRRLRDDGLEKVRQGLTSIAEIARVVGSS